MVVVMNVMLSSIGVNVGSEKFLYVFSMFDVSVVSEMNMMYGNMICVIVIVSGNVWLLLCRLDVIVNMIYDVLVILMIDSMVSVYVSMVDIVLMSVFVVLCFCWFLNLVRIGMNVCENVFLVDRWCSRFGMWKVM